MSQLDYFHYTEGKMELGETYQYTKSNIDGTHPITVYIHLSSFEEIEALKIHEGGFHGDYVKAEMDWRLFSVERIKSHYVYHDTTKKPQASLRRKESQKYTGEAYAQASPDPVSRFIFNVDHYPWHIYNFDLASLNISMRHLKEPEKTFEVSIYDPVFGEAGTTFEYKGEFICDYMGDELRHSHRCRYYQVSGDGVGGAEGDLWVDIEGGHIVDIEVPFPNNPSWESFKLRLQSISNLNPEEWIKFISDTCSSKLRARE